MSDEEKVKDVADKVLDFPRYQLFVEPRGQYTIVKEKRAWFITFPLDAKIEDNIEALAEINKALIQALVEQKKKEDEGKKDKKEESESR